MLYPAPVSAPTSPYGAVAMSIIGRLPDTARLITDMHPLASDPENMGEPLQCDVCGITKCASRMAVLVDSENMPDAGGPTYVEACEHCIDQVCEKLADAGVGVDVED